MTDHDCYDEDDETENVVYLDCMKKLSKEQMKKFPKLVVEGIVCQSYYMSRFEKCTGCTSAISGCEKIFEAGCN
jgi:hypothetical protein